MKLLAFCLLAITASLASASLLTSSGPVRIESLNYDIIDEVNAANAGWKAAPQEYFKSHTLASAKRLMGVPEISKDANAHLPSRSWSAALKSGSVSLPTNFDSRDQWKGCIGPILDQGQCGSCWAFGAVETVSDRYCIARRAGNSTASFLQLAPLDLVTCDEGFIFGDNGCHGGMPSSALSWIKKHGLVTETCRPYLKSEGGPIPTCTDQPCLNFVSTPKCDKACKDSESYDSSKHDIVSEVYSVSGEADSIATEIFKNGPVEAAMTVYEDFVHYQSGVYTHTTGQALGGHAIKIIGFGVEDGKDYWLVANSWTTGWGDKGLFKIAKGNDECGIESGVVTVTPKA